MHIDYDVFIGWLGENKVLVVGALFITMTAIFTSPTMTRWEWLSYIPKRRGRMLRRARREFVESLITEDFTSSIENRVYHGAISREEAREMYRKLKQLFPVRGLFPAAHLLKENIKRRMESGLNEPMPFPDKKPETKRKLKHVFDKPKRVTL